MNRRLTAIVEREGDGYVALCPEVDVASQGDTVAEARENLQEALTLFFGIASADEIDKRLRGEVYVRVRTAGESARAPRGVKSASTETDRSLAPKRVMNLEVS